MIYLDNAATTPLCNAAKQTIIEHLDNYGNPSSSYEWGRISKNLIEDAIIHMKIRPIDKDEMKYAKRKIDFAMNFFQDIAEMKKKSMEFSNIAELRATDIPEGTVVATKGFYTEGDGGAAVYTILD